MDNDLSIYVIASAIIAVSIGFFADHAIDYILAFVWWVVAVVYLARAVWRRTNDG